MRLKRLLIIRLTKYLYETRAEINVLKRAMHHKNYISIQLYEMDTFHYLHLFILWHISIQLYEMDTFHYLHLFILWHISIQLYEMDTFHYLDLFILWHISIQLYEMDTFHYLHLFILWHISIQQLQNLLGINFRVLRTTRKQK
jgi:hypothetical protein